MFNFLKTWNFFRAPEGCLQYFTGISGEFQSFSFNDGDTSMLLTTDYVICFRRERDFCQIDFSVQPASGNKEFVLGDTGTRTGGSIPDNEKAVYLEITGSSNELYSGQNFADLVVAGTQQTTNGVVRGNIRGCGPSGTLLNSVKCGPHPSHFGNKIRIR